MFSETRYARNGDLRVAYRASAEGERDIVFVSPPFTNCEVFTELPSIQGHHHDPSYVIEGAAKMTGQTAFHAPIRSTRGGVEYASTTETREPFTSSAQGPRL